MAFYWGQAGGSIVGTQDNDLIFGSATDDIIFGYADPLRAGGITQARQSITDAADIIFAGAGNDVVYAGGGSDIVSGGSGNDTLDGGPDKDWICGGDGADVFRFALLEASPNSFTLHSRNDPGLRDLILDYRQSDGDKIDLSGWQNREVPGAFFIAEDPAWATGQLQVGFSYEDGKTIIELYRPWQILGPDGVYNAPVAPAGYIEILGIVPLTAADFIF